LTTQTLRLAFISKLLGQRREGLFAKGWLTPGMESKKELSLACFIKAGLVTI